MINLIKSYFNFYFRKLEYKIKIKRMRTRFRRLSTNRIFVSRADLKHDSHKVTATIYIYNRQKKYYINKIKRLNAIRLTSRKRRIIHKILVRKIRLIKLQGLALIAKVQKEKNLLLMRPEWANANFKYYEKSYYANFISKCLKKQMLNIYYKRIVYFNTSKFENTHIHKLKSIIKKIYNKNVEFNLVNLKYLYLNSDIFSQSMAIKLRNKNNRLLRVLKACMGVVRSNTRLHKKYTSNTKKSSYLWNRVQQNLNVNYLLSCEDQHSKDALDLNLEKRFPPYYTNVKPYNVLLNTVLNCIKNKYINGVRVEAAGRLSRRFTAARSVFKYKYLGNLQNHYSSSDGFSSVLLRGHVKSNLQYTKLKSKTRIGSFGLKG